PARHRRPKAILETPHRRRIADIDFVVLQRTDIDHAEWTWHEQLRQRWRLVAHLHVHANVAGRWTIAKPVVKRRLQIDARRDWEIARRRDDLRRLDAAEMIAERFLKARFEEPAQHGAAPGAGMVTLASFIDTSVRQSGVSARSMTRPTIRLRPTSRTAAGRGRTDRFRATVHGRRWAHQPAPRQVGRAPHTRHTPCASDARQAGRRSACV